MTAASVVLALVAPASAGADAGVMGHWPLDQGSGAIAADTSGHGDNGVVAGAAQWVPGVTGSALSFDGGTARIQIPDSASLEPRTVSVSAWIERSGSPGDWKYILAKGAADCIAASYGLYSGPNGGLEFYVGTDGGRSYVPSPDAGPGVWDDAWHLATGTFDGATVRLYVDGRQIGDGTPDASPISYGLPDSNDLFIGYYPVACDRNFSGSIDDPEVWAGALTPTIVGATFAGTPTPGNPPPPNPPAPAATTTTHTGPGAGGSAPPGSGGAGTPGATGAGTAAPPAPHDAVLRLGPAVFRAVGARRRGGHPGAGVGTVISYVDSQAAVTTIEVRAQRPGVLRGGRCVAATRSARAASCRRWVWIGNLTHADSAGLNRLRFNGRIGSRALAPGVYRVELTATSDAGVRGITVTSRFTIVG